jgi:hypothetical protein
VIRHRSRFAPWRPAGLAVGRDERIYFADLEADRIRVLTAVDL